MPGRAHESWLPDPEDLAVSLLFDRLTPKQRKVVREAMNDAARTMEMAVKDRFEGQANIVRIRPPSPEQLANRDLMISTAQLLNRWVINYGRK